MRFLSLVILICLCLSSNAQASLPLDWGPTYDRIAAESQHFFYLDHWDNHHYLRTGKDNTQLLHKISTDNKVVKTIALTKKYQGLQVYFEKFIETTKGKYGYFKAPNPDDSELVLLVAPFEEDSFGELLEIYRHEYIKVPGIFQNTYPFIHRDWINHQATQQLLDLSPDRSKIVYASYHTPKGYRGMKPHNGLNIVVFNDQFVVEKDLLLEEAFEEEGTLNNIVVDNGGNIFGILKKYMKKSDWKKAEISGKYLPRYQSSLVRFDEEPNIIPIANGEGVAMANIDFLWDAKNKVYRLAGCYTTGETEHGLDGFYISDVTEGGERSHLLSNFPEELLSQEMAYFRNYKTDYETQVLDKPLSELDDVGHHLHLKKLHYNQDGSISWLFERFYDQRTTDDVRLRISSIFLFIQTDEQGNLLSHKIYNKFFVATYNETPATLLWSEGDQFHLIYPNMRSLISRRALDESLKGGGALEYLVIDASGETVGFETLMSNLSYNFDFNHPLGQHNGKVLFTKLTRDQYSLGSYDTN